MMKHWFIACIGLGSCAVNDPPSVEVEAELEAQVQCHQIEKHVAAIGYVGEGAARRAAEADCLAQCMPHGCVCGVSTIITRQRGQQWDGLGQRRVVRRIGGVAFIEYLAQCMDPPPPPNAGDCVENPCNPSCNYDVCANPDICAEGITETLYCTGDTPETEVCGPTCLW
jgi:hypothetical protein